MTRGLLIAATLLVALPGCTISAVTAADESRPNSCSNDSDCKNGNCSAGICQTLNGQLEALLIEVTPPSDSALPHLTLLTRVDNVPTSGGERALTVARPAHITGSLSVGPTATCYPTFSADLTKPLFQAPDGHSLPVSVTLTPRERLLGLPQQLYFAATGELKGGGYSFEMQVPAGEYDVYVVPPRGQLSCAVPPQLFRRQAITGGEYALQYTIGATSALTLHVRWPKTNPPLTGWIADIIEPLGGNAISSELVLDQLTEPKDGSPPEYVVKLAYSAVHELQPAAEPGASASDLVRLRPPANVVAPTIFLDRSAFGLFSPSASDDFDVLLDDFTRVPEPVQVQGQLARLDDGEPVGGYVTLVSTDISGVDPGIFASFQTTRQVDASGLFSVDLPPGTYRVYAVPPTPTGAGSVEGALSALETTWDIPADTAFQAGKLLELPPIAAIRGQSSVPGAQVHARASSETVLPFEEVFGAAAFVPRATSGLVDDAGRFVVQADPGRFDISVRAPEPLGFGWFVRPGVDVPQEGQDLGRVNLPTPSLLTGTAAVAIGSTTVAVSSALVRAYAYLDKDLAYTRDPTEARSVIQVAETRADENGAFRLLLPSSIAASK